MKSNPSAPFGSSAATALARKPVTALPTFAGNLASADLAPPCLPIFRSAWKLYYNLLWLNGEIGSGAGHVAGGTDFRPTDTEVTLAHQYEQELARAESDYHNLMTKDLPAFNHELTEHNIIPLATSGAPAAAPQPDSHDE